jgi:glycosyltransferase involved in cell wall biosynthesis
MQNAVTLDLVPNEQIARIEDGQGNSYWRATGNDGHFLCPAAPGTFPLPGGWYRLDLSLRRRQGKLVSPMLYPDYGLGALESMRIHLPFVSRGSDHCIVRFTSAVSSIRLDPSASVCEFDCTPPVLTRMGRSAAFLGLLAGVLAEQSSVRAKLGRLFVGVKKLATHGLSGFGDWLYNSYVGTGGGEVTASYQDWIELYERDFPIDDRSVDLRLAALHRNPRFSVVMPVYNTDEKWLRACIDSVLSQDYPHWELCIADDASPAPHVRFVLDEYVAKDERIRVAYRAANGHISAASNTALDMATGDFVALLDHDDELHPKALLAMAEAIDSHRQWRMIYSDEDKIDTEGRRYEPYFKADWNYDLFLAQNCVCHLGVYDTALLREIGGFRLGIEGSQDWDLALRCVERLRPDEIGHVPAILYHWRAIPGSTALSADQKSYAQDTGREAVSAHLARVYPDAQVENIAGQPGNYRIRYSLPTPSPKVTLIVPTRDRVDLLRMCVSSILSITQYDNFEILVVDNGSVEEETLAYFASLADEPRVRVLPYPHRFNYSAINNFAAAHTDADIIGLVNNDIEAISPDWLHEMASHAWRPEIGAVGALLYYPNDTVQHAGVVTGIGGVAGHVHHGFPRGSLGYFSRMALVQNLSAVTAACLLIRRSVYEQVGGLDEQLEVAFNDVDFCLRVREAGYRNLWTPFAALYHHESASRGYENTPEKWARFQKEAFFMQTRWGSALKHDPAYNPNLSLTTAPYHLAFPPRDWRAMEIIINAEKFSEK